MDMNHDHAEGGMMPMEMDMMYMYFYQTPKLTLLFKNLNSDSGGTYFLLLLITAALSFALEALSFLRF